MLDRDTGEHITTSQGELQYIPFSICNETNRPLELYFGDEKGKKILFGELFGFETERIRHQLHCHFDHRLLVPPPRVLYTQ